jgi:uncharacterized membrane protein YedE/YeeE
VNARRASIPLFVYLAAGVYLGIVLTKSEAISWFRIQEMFRFQSFHMYGIMASALAVGALSIHLIRRLRLQALTGNPIEIAPKKMTAPGYRYWIGGSIFGMGWGLLGACPGPIFALVGSGASVMIVALAGAIAGTWTYGLLRERLPH